jgi:ATP-binding cassette subfamily B protein
LIAFNKGGSVAIFSLSLGQIMTLQFYSFFIFGPLQEVGNVIIAYREAEASLNNFEKIIQTPIETKPEHPIPLNAIEKLAFSDLTFRHKSSNYDALSNINFEVQKAKKDDPILFNNNDH